MRIEAVELRQLEIPMVEPMSTAHGVVESRRTILVHVITDVGEGWGECVALPEPTYTADWSNGEYELLREIFGPLIVQTGEVTAETTSQVLNRYQQHNMAKSALEMAVLDAELRASNTSLAEYWNVSEKWVECAIVVGLVEGDALLRSVHRHLERGYRQLKLKIAPGLDIERIDLVRKEFPELAIRADANGSYQWDDPAHRVLLREIDERGLALIEQPLRPDRARPYMELKAQMRTPIALDESITSWERALNALELEVCDVIVLKPGTVGGYLTAKRVHDECCSRRVATMVGGMIETAVARSANLALAALSGSAGYPSEISPDGRWFYDRINCEPVEMKEGRIAVPTGPGLGVELDLEAVNRLTSRSHIVRRN